MQLRLTVRRTAKKAAQIITVSEYSRQDISKTYKIPSERITVTPEAASEKFFPVTEGSELKTIRKTYGHRARLHFLTLFDPAAQESDSTYRSILAVAQLFG